MSISFTFEHNGKKYSGNDIDKGVRALFDDLKYQAVRQHVETATKHLAERIGQQAGTVTISFSGDQAHIDINGFDDELTADITSSLQ